MKQSRCDRRSPRSRRGGAGAALLVIVGALVAGTSGVSGQGVPDDAVPATECCLALLFPIGARALALGNALTARGTSTGLFVNPASLASVEDQFLVHNASTSLEDSNTFSLVVAAGLVGTFGLSYRLIDHGEQDARDASGNPTGTLGVLEQVLTATYATEVAAGLDAGVSYKLYQFRQDCRGFCGVEGFAATTHSLDLGVHYAPGGIRGLEFGAAVVHLGFPLQVINAEQASPVPTRVRAGAAYEVLHHFSSDSAHAVHLMADFVTGVRASGGPLVNVGAEATLDGTIFLRAGYAGGTGITSGGAVGIGLHYDRFELGIAKGFVSSPIDDTEPVQITFGVRF